MTFFFQTNPIGVILKLPWIFKVLSLQLAGVSVEQSMRHQINVCVYSINTHTHTVMAKNIGTLGKYDQKSEN